MRLMDCSVLEAPYDSANLPLLTLSNLSWPHCFWMNVSFSKIWQLISGRIMSWLPKIIISLWRWKNFCNGTSIFLMPGYQQSTFYADRSNRLNKLATLLTSSPSTKGPCYHAPSMSLDPFDDLLCTSCSIANDTCWAPSISGTTPRAEKEKGWRRSMWNHGTVSVVNILSPLSHDWCWHLWAKLHWLCWSLIWAHFHQHQINLSSRIHLRQASIECAAANVVVTIMSYHSDNGIFSSDKIKQHCGELNQKLTFSGARAKL